MAPIFGVHQSLGHQHWKPEQERRMLTVILQTHTKMSFIHANPWKFPEIHRSICKDKVPKRVRAAPEIHYLFFFNVYLSTHSWDSLENTGCRAKLFKNRIAYLIGW